jgi:hypothetical protein
VGQERLGPSYFFISARPSKQPLMVRTFLKVYMELGSYFVSARTNMQIKDIIIIEGPKSCQQDARRPSRRSSWGFPSLLLQCR